MVDERPMTCARKSVSLDPGSLDDDRNTQPPLSGSFLALVSILAILVHTPKDEGKIGAMLAGNWTSSQRVGIAKIRGPLLPFSSMTIL